MAEKKYIDAEMLTEFLQCDDGGGMSCEYNCDGCTDTDCIECVCEVISNQPAADVVEVKHGEWVCTDGDNEEYESGHSAWVEFHCFCCNYDMSLETGEYGWSYDEDCKIPFKYCPNCGARMDGAK